MLGYLPNPQDQTNRFGCNITTSITHSCHYYPMWDLGTNQSCYSYMNISTNLPFYVCVFYHTTSNYSLASIPLNGSLFLTIQVRYHQKSNAYCKSFTQQWVEITWKSPPSTIGAINTTQYCYL